MKTPQERIDEWCEWNHEKHYALAPRSQSVMQRMVEERENAGARGSGFAYTMIDDTPCRPDGGVGAMIDRMYGSLKWDERCREVQDAYDAMPIAMRAIVQARYVGHWRDTPRSHRDAADIIGLDHVTFFDQHKAMLKWLGERLREIVQKAA